SSRSLKARNGVGVRADGKVVFAISQAEISFDAFARLFRDALKCPNALFLDGGTASNLYAPSLNRLGNIVSLGPMLAVFEKNSAAPRQYRCPPSRPFPPPGSGLEPNAEPATA